MNQTDTRNFLVAINALQGYVPPMIFAQVITNPTCRVLEGIANGQLSFQVGSPPPANGSGEAKPNGSGEGKPLAEQPQQDGEVGAG